MESRDTDADAASMESRDTDADAMADAGKWDALAAVGSAPIAESVAVQELLS